MWLHLWKTYKNKKHVTASHPTSLATSLPIPWSLQRSHNFTSDWLGDLTESVKIRLGIHVLPHHLLQPVNFFWKKKTETKRPPPCSVGFFGKGGGKQIENFQIFQPWNLFNQRVTQMVSSGEFLRFILSQISSLPTTRSPGSPVPPKSITKEHPAMYIPQTETYVQPRLLWQSRV